MTAQRSNDDESIPVGREQVIKAATEAAAILFSEHQPSQVTVRDIAAAAGVSHALLHRYMGTKEDIFLAALEYDHALIAEKVKEARGMAGVGSPERVRRLVDAILQALAEQSRIVRLPLNRAGTLYRIGKVVRTLGQELGRQPSVDEIAKRIKLPREEVRDTLSISNSYLSLDDPFEGDEDNSLMDYLPDETSARPDQVTFGHTLEQDLRAALTALEPREERILRLYFGIDGAEPMTLEEIGAQLGLTRERIRQIKEKALAKLRNADGSRCLEAYVEG